MLVHLIGPGAAGKTTTGRALSDRLGVPFVDLDEAYLRDRSIEDDIETRGYAFYAQTNVALYLRLRGSSSQGVFALSSGFMTYPPGIHHEIENIKSALLDARSTVLLLPSRDADECIALTLQRQSTRHYAGSEATERAKIVARLPLYASMQVKTVCTNQGMEHVLDEIVAFLR